MCKLINELDQIIRGFSYTEKMPCLSWSTSAYGCKTGSELRKRPGSVCASCYACKGNYLYPSVSNCLDDRLGTLEDLDAWKQAMIDLLRWHAARGTKLRNGDVADPGFFRWHDSGDLQSVEHLGAICDIAHALPEIRFWLPTKEPGIVAKYLKIHGNLPENLTIRLSAFYVGKAPKIAAGWHAAGVRGSAVDLPSATECQIKQDPNTGKGRCFDCRLCWDRDVECISYHKH